MVAYSFKAQFRTRILAGTKRQTIRSDRKRHARPGEQIQLYTGMRTRSCALIARAICQACVPIRIGVADQWIETETGRIDDLPTLELFAAVDGFESWSAMRAFWQREHRDQPTFFGVLIRWNGLVEGTG